MIKFSPSQAVLAASMAVLTSLSFSSAASAQSIVLGDGDARQCYLKVKYGDKGRKSSIDICKRALSEGVLSKKDRASTHVNLGILQMRHKDYALAETNYKKALKMKPEMGEIYINLSANEIYQGRYEDALVTVNKAIDLNTIKMPEALFNRAMIYHHAGRYKEAYQDLKQALVIRPDWEPAIKKLDDYVVTTKSAS